MQSMCTSIQERACFEHMISEIGLDITALGTREGLRVTERFLPDRILVWSEVREVWVPPIVLRIVLKSWPDWDWRYSKIELFWERMEVALDVVRKVLKEE